MTPRKPKRSGSEIDFDVRKIGEVQVAQELVATLTLDRAEIDDWPELPGILPVNGGHFLCDDFDRIADDFAQALKRRIELKRSGARRAVLQNEKPPFETDQPVLCRSECLLEA